LVPIVYGENQLHREIEMGACKSLVRGRGGGLSIATLPGTRENTAATQVTRDLRRPNHRYRKNNRFVVDDLRIYCNRNLRKKRAHGNESVAGTRRGGGFGKWQQAMRLEA
jgi:hypothetical protein